MERYLKVFRNPHALRLLVAPFPARVAYSMISLGIFFRTEQQTSSISIAGVAVGLNSIAGSLTAGVRGSFIDRFGLKWPLRVFVPAYSGLIILFNLQTEKTALVVSAFILGFTAPPINLSIRPLWKISVPKDLQRTAFAIDTAVMNAATVIGPVVATTLALSTHPSLCLNLCATFMLVGGTSLALTPKTKEWRPERVDSSRIHIWKVRAIQLLMLEGIFLGLGWGAFNIGIPAFATLENVPKETGSIFAVMAVFNVIGGLLAGLISRRTSSLGAFRRIYLAWFVFSIPLALSSPGWTILVVVSLIGLTGGATQVFYWEITEAVRPPGTAASAMGWLWSVEGSFQALGAAIGGVVADKLSPRYCLAATTISLAIGYLIFTFGRPILKAADRIPTEEEDELAMEDLTDKNK